MGAVVDLEIVEKALARVVREIRERNGGSSTVEVSSDYYWSIAPEELSEIERTPVELTIGQISESMGWIHRVVDGERNPISYDLVWIADVLRAAGYADGFQYKGK